jgi:hypothetical protein
MRDGSIRLRLGRSDVDRFAQDGVVMERIDLGAAGALEWELRSDDGAGVRASIEAGRIIVRVDRAKAENWAGSEIVGFEAEQVDAAGSVVRILVEKDFACLQERAGEDDSDAYPNPETV